MKNPFQLQTWNYIYIQYKKFIKTYKSPKPLHFLPSTKKKGTNKTFCIIYLIFFTTQQSNVIIIFFFLIWVKLINLYKGKSLLLLFLELIIKNKTKLFTWISFYLSWIIYLILCCFYKKKNNHVNSFYVCLYEKHISCMLISI